MFPLISQRTVSSSFNLFDLRKSNKTLRAQQRIRVFSVRCKDILMDCTYAIALAPPKILLKQKTCCNRSVRLKPNQNKFSKILKTFFTIKDVIQINLSLKILQNVSKPNYRPVSSRFQANLLINFQTTTRRPRSCKSVERALIWKVSLVAA